MGWVTGRYPACKNLAPDFPKSSLGELQGTWSPESKQPIKQKPNVTGAVLALMIIVLAEIPMLVCLRMATDSFSELKEPCTNNTNRVNS